MTGIDYGSADEVVADLLAEPMDVFDISIGNAVGEFDFDGEDSTVGALHDDVDLVVPVACSQVAYAGPYASGRP